MKLLYDLAGVFQATSPVHGGGVYAASLLEEILNLGDRARSGVELTALVPPDLPARDPRLHELLESFGIDRAEMKRSADLPEFLAAGGRWDAFYTALPYDLPDVLGPGYTPNMPIIGTVHGLRDFDIVYDRHYRSYIRNPVVRGRMWFWHLLPGSYHHRMKARFSSLFSLLGGNIITVSSHTKYQLLAEFPRLQPERIEVISPLSQRRRNDADAGGVNAAAPESPDVSVLQSHGLEPRSYLLLLSCDRPVKNTFRVLEALEYKRVTGAEDLRVVCVGFRPHQVATVRRRFPRTAARIVLVPYVGREDLDALYAGAFAFVYPSISEGFGYPPLEAMRHATPVLASPHSAVSEVCGDAVLYANPYSVSEIAARLSRIIVEEPLREALVSRGRERSAAYEHGRAERAGRFLDYVRRVLDGYKTDHDIT